MPAASASLLLQALEAVAVVLTLLSVWWARQRDRRTWPVGGAAALAYGGWFVAHGWWGNAAFQLLVLAQSLWGWSRWGADIPPLSRRQLTVISSTMALLAAVVFSTVATTGIPQAEWALSLASVAATIGLIQQRPGSWAAWAVINVGYVALFLTTSAWLSAGLYAALTLFAIHTWLEWRRMASDVGLPVPVPTTLTVPATATATATVTETTTVPAPCGVPLPAPRRMAALFDRTGRTDRTPRPDSSPLQRTA